MRRLSLALILCGVMLAACTGGQSTTNATVPTTDPSLVTLEPTSPAFVIVTLPPSEVTEDLLEGLPGYGTLEASVTEDPNVALVFDKIQFYRYGGDSMANQLEIIINQDGSVTCAGVPGTTPLTQIETIDGMLDSINFFGLQAVFISLAPTTNLKYRLVVTRGEQERMIDSEEGFTPTEYNILLGEVQRVCGGL